MHALEIHLRFLHKQQLWPLIQVSRKFQKSRVWIVFVDVVRHDKIGKGFYARDFTLISDFTQHHVTKYRGKRYPALFTKEGIFIIKWCANSLITTTLQQWRLDWKRLSSWLTSWQKDRSLDFLRLACYWFFEFYIWGSIACFHFTRSRTNKHSIIWHHISAKITSLERTDLN